jgi:hypothetical protein
MYWLNVIAGAGVGAELGAGVCAGVGVDKWNLCGVFQVEVSKRVCVCGFLSFHLLME